MYFFLNYFNLFISGYDFGYLIKILTNSNLPEEELDFFEILRLFFPVIYDVKYLMKSCKNLKVRLQMTLSGTSTLVSPMSLNLEVEQPFHRDQLWPLENTNIYITVHTSNKITVMK